jgi:hypothetical protein
MNPPPWQRIETAPRDGTLITIWLVNPRFGTGRIVKDCWWDNDYWAWSEDTGFTWVVGCAGESATMWMPQFPARNANDPALRERQRAVSDELRLSRR